MDEELAAKKIASLYALLVKVDEPGTALECISHEEFITVWETSDNIGLAVGFMSVLAGRVLKPGRVRARVSRYRKSGIALKHM